MKTRSEVPEDNYVASIDEIVAYLRRQAELRAQENDEAGVLLEAADYVESEVQLLERSDSDV